MIELRPMTDPEYSEYLKSAVSLYAQEKMNGEGHSKDQAEKIAEESFADLLPDGLQTEDQFLFSIVEKSTNQNLGMIWFGKKRYPKPHAFVYDFLLNPESRGQGFGKLAMQLLEVEVKKQGLHSVGLHVFGHNKVAINLYEKVGFRTTNRIMVKDL